MERAIDGDEDVERSIELTAYEKLFVYYNLMGDANTMCSAFVENTTSPWSSAMVELNRDIVLGALKFMTLRHPYLRAYLLDIHSKQDRRMYFRIMKEEDKDNNLSAKIQLEWLDIGESPREKVIEYASIFNSKVFELVAAGTSNKQAKHFLWRVQVIQFTLNSKKCYCINFVCLKAITDGMNILTLVIELMNILNAMLTDADCEEMKIRLEPVENMHVLCQTRGELFKKGEHEAKIKAINKKKMKKFAIDKKLKPKNEEIGFGLDLFKLDNQTTKSIVQLAKQHNVKITAYFQTIVFHALKKLYDFVGIKLQRSLLIKCPTSLRIRYEPVLDFVHCGMHVSLMSVATDEKHFGDYQSFWKDCQYLNGLIQESLNVQNGHLFALSHSGTKVDEISRYLSGIKEGGGKKAHDSAHECNDCDITLSNLGSFVNERCQLFRGPFEIKELYCSSSLKSIANVSPAINIHTLFWRDEMMVQIGANKSCLANCFFKKYKELFLQTIEETMAVKF